jgi:hypothetical protein
MPAPDHMKGLNALPRWDPSDPTKYNYDPKNYDPNDYAKFKQARAERDQQRQVKDKAVMKKALQNAAQAIHDKANEIQGKPKRPRPVEWAGDSECFADLEYSAADGGVWATFNRGGQTPAPYFYPMSKAEARDWFDDDSVGAYFNDAVR